MYDNLIKIIQYYSILKFSKKNPFENKFFHKIDNLSDSIKEIYFVETKDMINHKYIEIESNFFHPINNFPNTN